MSQLTPKDEEFLKRLIREDKIGFRDFDKLFQAINRVLMDLDFARRYPNKPLEYIVPK
jgi:hypothetical protein